MTSPIEPVISQSIVYDTLNKTFTTQPPSSEDLLYIAGTTLCIPEFDTCFFHTYLDNYFPLISILREIDPVALATKQIRIFMQQPDWTGLPDKLCEYLQEITNKSISPPGNYTNAYKDLHTSFSAEPILFERYYIGPRYIQFERLIQGGNNNYQRCIHNCEKVYHMRQLEPPVASDAQILQWYAAGKEILASHLQIQPKPATSAPNIVWISRPHGRSPDSRSVNRLMVELDIEPIELETLPLKEQIQLFVNADIVISPHGSGLVHLIWCSPGTHVIELFEFQDPRYICFKRVCDLYSLTYTPLYCKSEAGRGEGFFELPDRIHIEIQEMIRRY